MAFSATLEEYRRRVADGMSAALAAGRPSPSLDRLMAAYPSRAGKGLRGALVLAVCQGLGGRAERALPFAVGIELLHNAFLIHDDVVDGSRYRRGAPTLPYEYGTGLALLAGDAL